MRAIRPQKPNGRSVPCAVITQGERPGRFPRILSLLHAFFVFTGLLRPALQVLQISQVVPSQPRAVQCSRP